MMQEMIYTDRWRIPPGNLLRSIPEWTRPSGKPLLCRKGNERHCVGIFIYLSVYYYYYY